MADFCCPPVVGGKLYISWGDKRLEAEHGTVRMMLADTKREARATASGRMVVTEEARLPEFEIEFHDICGAEPMDLYYARCHVNITVVSESTGKRYMYSDAAVTGDPQLDPATGRISGIKVSTDQFSMA